jgi:hypothetical protein
MLGDTGLRLNDFCSKSVAIRSTRRGMTVALFVSFKAVYGLAVYPKCVKDIKVAAASTAILSALYWTIKTADLWTFTGERS